MNVEIERKFLVTDTAFLQGVPGRPMRQAYISRTERGTVRVRVAGEFAWLTLKGRAQGIRRSEFEYAIPVMDAERMIAELSDGAAIIKTRHEVPFGRHLWEVDVFAGDNAGLVVAEIELEHEDETFERPPWLGPEVSRDLRYSNSSLCLRPYNTW